MIDDSLPLSETERDMVAMTRDLARDVVAARADAIAESHDFPWDIYRTFCDLGLLGLPVPAEYGGIGASVLLQCLIAEEVAKVCSVSASLIAGPSLASYPIVLAGTDEQKQRYLPRLATGELQAAFALTEPNAGSDNAAMETRAVRDGDDYVIDGHKCFITRGNISGLLMVFAKTDPDAPKLSGISGFLVEQDVENGTPGIVVDRLERKMGQEASPTVALTFTGLRVPATAMLGAENEGMRALRALHKTRPLAAAVALGIGTGAYEYARDYLLERRQFGQPIAQFQAVQFMVADMAIKLEAARRLTYHAAIMADAGTGGRTAETSASMAKVLATDTAMAVTTDAVQLLGGYGYMKDFPVERRFRAAKLYQIVEGTNQIQRHIIANNVLFRR
ncbi:acyl-CoA dehydrogenase family protein [Jiangella anatolica]|nr:acyl-CoA dehydrogenase family protein [Jiangella anatolica]